MPIKKKEPKRLIKSSSQQKRPSPNPDKKEYGAVYGKSVPRKSANNFAPGATSKIPPSVFQSAFLGLGSKIVG
jgi:hypothetical protein